MSKIPAQPVASCVYCDVPAPAGHSHRCEVTPLKSKIDDLVARVRELERNALKSVDRLNAVRNRMLRAETECDALRAQLAAAVDGLELFRKLEGRPSNEPQWWGDYHNAQNAARVIVDAALAGKEGGNG